MNLTNRKAQYQAAAKPILILIVSFLIAICVDSFLTFAAECGDIRGSVLRLHILANSDSTEDQQIKLLVRDRILAETGDIFGESGSLPEAKETVEANVQKVTEIAQAVLKENGFSETVNTEITNMYFDTRYYETFTLPAGYYDAVRVTIGEAKGKNWWCVLYPPLCIPAANAQVEMDQTLTQEEQEIISNSERYEVRFLTVEIFEKFKSWWKERE